MVVLATAVVPGTLQLFIKRSRAVRYKTKHPWATLTKLGKKYAQESQSIGGRGPTARSHKSCVLLVFMWEKVGESEGDPSACDRHGNRSIPTWPAGVHWEGKWMRLRASGWSWESLFIPVTVKCMGMMKGLEAQLPGALRPEQGCLLSRTSPQEEGLLHGSEVSRSRSRMKEEKKRKGPNTEMEWGHLRKQDTFVPSRNMGMKKTELLELRGAASIMCSRSSGKWNSHENEQQSNN